MDIKALAREAGIHAYPGNNDEHPLWMVAFLDNTSLPRFARLIAEECAKVCESMDGADVDGTAGSCAQAIRDKFGG